MRKFGTVDLIGYAVFAALFLAVAALHPAHAATRAHVATLTISTPVSST
jgi:hypothetical protein